MRRPTYAEVMNELSARKRAEGLRVKQVQFYTQFVLTSYVSLLDDYALTLVDRLWEKYSKTKTFENNAQFANLLTALKKNADDHYAFLNKTVKDTQFYADLRDGASEYLDSKVVKLFKEINEIYRDSHVKNNALIGACAGIFTVVQCIQYRIDDVIMPLAPKFSIKGVDPYRLENIKQGVSLIIDLMGRNFDSKYDKRFQDILVEFGNAVTPQHLVYEAGVSARNLFGRDLPSDFVKHCNHIFKINL